MNKLFYEYIIPPRKIILKSEALQLDCILDQNNWDTDDYKHEIIGVDDLFNLAKTGLFEEIRYFVEDDMKAYYVGCEGNVGVKGWVDILEYEKGGEW